MYTCVTVWFLPHAYSSKSHDTNSQHALPCVASGERTNRRQEGADARHRRIRLLRQVDDEAAREERDGAVSEERRCGRVEPARGANDRGERRDLARWRVGGRARRRPEHEDHAARRRADACACRSTMLCAACALGNSDDSMCFTSASTAGWIAAASAS